MPVPWVTVWGYGADIRATRDTLTVRRNGQTEKHRLSDVSHLLIAGGHTLHTASLRHLLACRIPVSFFDVHGKPAGRLSVPGKNPYPLESVQKHAPPHRFAMAVITASLKARMLFLHELAERSPDGLFYQGEFEILTEAANEIAYLVTLQEISRVFSLTEAMYYEVLSRAVPKDLGYRRRIKPPYMDPVNAMFAHGYAVLYATAAVAVEGAELDPSIGILPDSEGLVFDLMEAAKTPMVDRVVIGMADCLQDGYDLNLRCVLSEEVMAELNRRLAESVNGQRIAGNVQAFRKALEDGDEWSLRF
jgi:CRISPR-associated endonuclease Cas1